MPATTFPAVLKTPQVTGYSRELTPSFKEAQPMSGPPYSERLTFDTPATWQVQFRYAGDFARLFWQWFIEETEEGNLDFEIPLAIESGIHPQVCKFTQDGLPSLTAKDGNIYTYTATLRSRAINDPDAGNFAALLAQLTPE